MLVKVGTGGSRLSLVQADLVIERLRQIGLELNIERKTVNNDEENGRISLLPPNKRRALWREIDREVLEGRVDFTVQNMTDIPVFQGNDALTIAGVLERGSPAEVLVSRDGRRLRELETGRIVGTSSLLRIAQLKSVRRDLKPEHVYGGVDNYLRKVDTGELDAVILSEAKLARLGLVGKISERLHSKDFMPAPGQGILAMVARRENRKVVDLLRKIEHPLTRAEAEAEREIVRVVQESCRVPVAALASAVGEKVKLEAHVLSVDGRERLRASVSGNIRDTLVLGRKLGEDLVAQGAKRLEEGWRGMIR